MTIHVATDGSYSEVHKIGAWAWVSSDGTFRAKTLSPHLETDSNSIEINAIHEALKQYKNASDLVIITDSKIALRCVENGLEGRSFPERTGHILRDIRAAVNLFEAEGRHVRFEWVRGHTGHPLNHAADKISSKLRLKATQDVPRNEFQVLLESLAATAFRQWSRNPVKASHESIGFSRGVLPL